MFSPEFFIKAGQLLLSLSILIALHELGHFIPARIFGCRVEKFYLFFDVKYSLFKNFSKIDLPPSSVGTYSVPRKK